MKRLEHVGIAVTDVDRIRSLWQTLFGREPYKTESVASEGVRTHFLEAGTAKIEFLESMDDGSPVARFLEKRGPGLHHLAFEVDDVDDAAERVAAEGFRLLGQVKDGADGKRIVFLHPKDTGGVLVELCAQSEFPRISDDAGQVCLPDSTPNDALAHALSRHMPVRSEPVSGVAAVAVAPGADWWHAIPADVRLAVVDPGPGMDSIMTAVGARLLVVQTRPGRAIPGGPRHVIVPSDLLDRLPDGWGTVSDLVAAHVRPA